MDILLYDGDKQELIEWALNADFLTEDMAEALADYSVDDIKQAIRAGASEIGVTL